MLGFILVDLYALYLMGTGIWLLLIGLKKIQHPMYDTEKKLLFAKRKGLFLIVPASFGLIIFSYFTLMYIK